jgi:hypothetical protein
MAFLRGTPTVVVKGCVGVGHIEGPPKLSELAAINIGKRMDVPQTLKVFNHFNLPKFPHDDTIGFEENVPRNKSSFILRIIEHVEIRRVYLRLEGAFRRRQASCIRVNLSVTLNVTS